MGGKGGLEDDKHLGGTRRGRTGEWRGPAHARSLWLPHWPSCRVMISRGIALQTWARQPGPAGVTAQTKAWQPDAQDVESERSPRFLTPVFGLRVCSAGLPAAGGPGCPTWVSFPPRHLLREFGTGAERGHAPYCPPASAPRLRGDTSWGCRVATSAERR